MKNIFVTVLGIFICHLIVAQRVATVRLDGKVGFIKDDGSWLIEPTYVKAGNFSDGAVAVFDGDKWGYLDTGGETIVPFEYDKVKRFGGGIALVNKDKRWLYIDKTGKELDMPDSDKKYDFNESGGAFISRNGLIGLMDHNGKVVIEPKYNKIQPYKMGFLKVKSGELWGTIGTSGEVVVEPIYEEIGAYREGMVVVKKDGVYGLLDENGFIPVDGAYKIWDFPEEGNLARAENRDKKNGFIDRSGKWIIDPKFEKARNFDNGVAPVSEDGKLWGYIDNRGDFVIPPKFKDAEIFSSDNLAPVKLSKAWGFINKEGELVIEDKYAISAKSFNFFKKQAKGFIKGLARVSYKKKWGYIDVNGDLLANTWFENAENFVKK